MLAGILLALVQAPATFEPGASKHAAGAAEIIPLQPRLLECETSEEEVRALVARLSDDDPAERRKATAALRTCAFRHETLLRKARAETGDAETRARLDETLDALGEWEAVLDRLRADPEALLDGVAPGTPLEAPRRILTDRVRAAAEAGRTEREEFDRLMKKAMLLAEEGNKAEALGMLKAARPRFELTGLAVRLQELIEKLDR